MKEWQNASDYKSMLTLMGSLSGLFSDSDIPFIYYRATENIFCKYLGAKNLARDDSAYDARLGNVGVGIKTFQLKNGRSVEKIAEFNALSTQLRPLNGEDLMLKLAEFRNERMQVANDLYGITDSEYHIIGRSIGQLEVFDSPYDKVDINTLKIISENDKSLHFKDKNHIYTFNRSKSVLMKQFIVPDNKLILPVSIIEDPYELLEKLINKKVIPTLQTRTAGREYVVLPLFSTKGVKEAKERYVPERSGLNQWNADGRPRHPNEVYIPVPIKIRNEHEGFFPSRDVEFTLHLPDDKTVMSAKICQDGGKALMSNPNKALGEWILRKVLHLKERELLTYDRLLASGFDSLVVIKNSERDFTIDITTESFEY